jgi:hypothetical protein
MKEAQGRELPACIPRGQLCGRAQARPPRAAGARAPAQGEGIRLRGHPCRPGPLRPVPGLGGRHRARAPEWPDGIGRLWGRGDAPPEVGITWRSSAGSTAAGNLAPEPRFYPGSPRIARLSRGRRTAWSSGRSTPRNAPPCGRSSRASAGLGPRGRRLRRDEGLPAAGRAPRAGPHRPAVRGPGEWADIAARWPRASAPSRGDLRGLVSADGARPRRRVSPSSSRGHAVARRGADVDPDAPRMKGCGVASSIPRGNSTVRRADPRLSGQACCTGCDGAQGSVRWIVPK